MEQILIQETDFQMARNRIREAKKQQPGKKIIFTSSDDELNRKILEKEKIDVLLLSLSSRRDKQKQRNSGFNQVLAKEAKKKDVIIGINATEIFNSKGKEKAEILARIRQNIMLCSKNKLKMSFIPELKDKYGLKSLGLVLGMPTWMTREL